jgi:hypothetical protein
MISEMENCMSVAIINIDNPVSEQTADEIAFVQIEISDTENATAKLEQELNGAKMNC